MAIQGWLILGGYDGWRLFNPSRGAGSSGISSSWSHRQGVNEGTGGRLLGGEGRNLLDFRKVSHLFDH